MSFDFMFLIGGSFTGGLFKNFLNPFACDLFIVHRKYIYIPFQKTNQRYGLGIGADRR